MKRKFPDCCWSKIWPNEPFFVNIKLFFRFYSLNYFSDAFIKLFFRLYSSNYFSGFIHQIIFQILFVKLLFIVYLQIIFSDSNHKIIFQILLLVHSFLWDIWVWVSALTAQNLNPVQPTSCQLNPINPIKPIWTASWEKNLTSQNLTS